MEESVKILLLEDNLNDVEFIQRHLNKSDIKFQCLHTSDLNSFTEALSNFQPHIILSDYHLIGFTGMDALALVKQICPQIPFIIVTGTLDEETAVETIKKGAWDYIVKERLIRLSTAIKNALLLKAEKENNAINRENLKISEERFNIAVEGSNDGIWDYNLITNDIYYSVRWKSMLGYKDNEIEESYKSWEELLHPDDKKHSLSALEKHLKKETPFYEVEFRLKCKDGSFKWVSARGKAMFDKNGIPYRIAGSHTDISERKNAEEKLRQSYIFNDSLIKTIPYAMDIVDENGTILFQNELFKTIIGENGVGKKCWKLYKDDQTQCQTCPLHQGIKIGESDICESKNILGNKIFEISHTGMVFEGKKALLEIFKDITLKKQQELLLAARIRLIEYSAKSSARKLLQKVLDEVELFTQSKIGFFYFLNNNQDIIALQAKSTNTLKDSPNIKEEYSQYPISEAGVWADCVRERKPVIHNNYETISNIKGLPEEHKPIIRELVIPIFSDGTIVAMLGVGNKSVDYNEQDVALAVQFAEVVWEIIDRKQTEENLKRSEAELDALFNNAPLIMMLVNRERQVVKMNTEAIAMSKRSRDEIIGALVGETLLCVNATDSPKGCGFGPKCPNCDFKNTIVKTFEIDETYYRTEVNLSYNHPDGLVDMHLLLSTSHVSTQDDNLVLVCLEDITQRTQAKNELKRSEQLLSEIGKLAKIGGWELDVRSMKTYFTEETYRMYGLAPNSPQIDAEKAIDFYPPEARELIQKHITRAIEHGEKYDIEAPFINAKGEHIWIRTIGNVAYEGKKVIRLFGSIQDITERKQAEEELIKHKNNLEDIVSERTEKLENAVYQLQAERDKAKRYLDIADVILLALNTDKNVTLINKKGCEVLGYSEAEIIGKNWYENFRDKTNRLEGEKEFSELLANNNSNSQYYENYIIKKNGERRLIAWHDISVMGNNGTVIGILSSGEDITERSKMENDLLEAIEIADKANLAKSAFLANMSHEIRTPMNAIIGFSEILGKMVDDKAQKSYLDSIKSSGKTLLNIINDVLDISKIEAGKVEIRKEPVSLKFLIEEMENMFSLRVAEMGLIFKKKFDASIPNYIESDELRLRQVLINLLNNAIKFTDAGEITIELKVLSKSKNSINLIINVIDTGIGISENNQKKIFDSFQQTEEQDSRKYGGTGLGLSISKKIIELLGGKISVNSKINEGSTFTISLPNVKIPKNLNQIGVKKHKYKPEEIKFKKASILVVDDIKDNRDIVKAYLADYDLIVSEAINGEQAIDMAIKQLPDLILMDLRMPKMDGYKATKLLKKNKKTLHIPIIALTASAYIKPEEEFTLIGFDGYIRKPMHIIELVNKISQFLEFQEIEVVQLENKKDTLNVPENLRDKLPEIITGFEAIKNEIWINIQKRQTLKGVQIFNTQLIQINKEFEIPLLNEYTASITDALTSFDIENIKNLVLEFPKIIESLKKEVQ